MKCCQKENDRRNKERERGRGRERERENRERCEMRSMSSLVISSHLFSPLLVSSHLFSSLARSCHLFGIHRDRTGTMQKKKGTEEGQETQRIEKDRHGRKRKNSKETVRPDGMVSHPSNPQL